MDIDGRPDFPGPLTNFPHAVTATTLEAVDALTSLWARASGTGTPQLSALQLQALFATQASPAINLRTLAEEIGVAPSAASRLCDRLEAAGLLRRAPAPASRREIGLVLTRRGRDVLDNVAVQRARTLSAVLQEMPAAARHELLSGLHAFAAVLRAAPSGGLDQA
ncbi:MarR family winged helix-turn-helix transcriptional regulator [Streptomyces kunmingensis]|uniref:MarR family winged helix-turn-helix transcriptional regulator n=1 Tax=Streptomyces kunmingensis TaxID=68225 RepID=A0ABU6CEU0_9ACTN|nr:MarR family winged helix-turn-helix transcriptional regulator [Streptomyces kunmingensis]MEB3962706.1 MarR family winged helix-turn-helix transcriptional regulator [Streptomyces kunmingensis]